MEAEGLPGGKHNVSDTAWAPVGAFARQSRPPTETQGTAPGNAFARQSRPPTETQGTAPGNVAAPAGGSAGAAHYAAGGWFSPRSEERRVGKEGRSRWWTYQQ